MIRVVLRHIEESESALIGEFPPSEIDGLIDRLRSEDIFIGEYEGCRLTEDPMQWIATDEARPHAVLEICVEN